MNNAELIKGLRWCADESICCDDFSGEKCPYFDEKKDSCSVDEILHAAADALEAAEKRIAELIPKEGEWIIDGMNEYELSYGCVGYEPIYRCSKCGITTESYLRTERPIMPEDADFPNYCPNCGARMDGKEQNDEQADC